MRPLALHKLELPDVTLVAVATQEVAETIKALEYSSKEINFGRILLIANSNPNVTDMPYDYIRIDKFSSVGDWGKFIIFDLYKHINTEYILLIHADGFVVNPSSWDDRFLNYDFIGAPWPLPSDNFSYRDFNGNIVRVGNSVSIRSKRLLEMPTRLGLSWNKCEYGYEHEDGYLTTRYRHIFESNGIKYAPFNLACKFSREATLPENKNIDPFAFHKWNGKNSNFPNFYNGYRYKMGIKRFLKMVKGIF